MKNTTRDVSADNAQMRNGITAAAVAKKRLASVNGGSIAIRMASACAHAVNGMPAGARVKAKSIIIKK